MSSIRFGQNIAKMPENLEFGEWGVMPMPAALDQFEAALAYFDSEAVRLAEKERTEMIIAARQYYDGNHRKPLKVELGEYDDNVLVNFCRSLIDDSVSWLFGNPETGVLHFDVEPVGDEAQDLDQEDEPEDVLDSAEETAEEQVENTLQAVYERSGGFRFFKRLGNRGSIAGHFFIKIVQEQDGPRLIVLDPLLVRVMTDPQDIDKVKAWSIEWRRREKLPTGRWADMIYRQLIVDVSDGEQTAYVVGDFKCEDRVKRNWQMDQIFGWPWAWSPIIDGRNIESGWGYYGLSDLEDAAGLNDALNFLVSNTMRILKFYADPKTIATGVRIEEVVETKVGGLFAIENEAARVFNLEMASDLTSSLAMMDFVRTAFWTIGRGMDPSVYKDKIGAVTNFALRVLAIRTIQKMGDKRLSYGEALNEANRRALEMVNVTGYKTIIQWPEPLPEDPADELKSLSEEYSLGVISLKTLSEELGRSYEQEQAQRKIENQETGNLGKYLLKQFDHGGDMLNQMRQARLNEGREPEDEGDTDDSGDSLNNLR